MYMYFRVQADWPPQEDITFECNFEDAKMCLTIEGYDSMASSVFQYGWKAGDDEPYAPNENYGARGLCKTSPQEFEKLRNDTELAASNYSFLWFLHARLAKSIQHGSEDDRLATGVPLPPHLPLHDSKRRHP